MRRFKKDDFRWANNLFRDIKENSNSKPYLWYIFSLDNISNKVNAKQPAVVS
jgi:hypothetical protein